MRLFHDFVIIYCWKAFVEEFMINYDTINNETLRFENKITSKFLCMIMCVCVCVVSCVHPKIYRGRVWKIVLFLSFGCNVMTQQKHPLWEKEVLYMVGMNQPTERMTNTKHWKLIATYSREETQLVQLWYPVVASALAMEAFAIRDGTKIACEMGGESIYGGRFSVNLHNVEQGWFWSVGGGHGVVGGNRY